MADEQLRLVVDARRGRLALRRWPAHVANHFRAADQRARVDAGEIANHGEDDDRPQSRGRRSRRTPRPPPPPRRSSTLSETGVFSHSMTRAPGRARIRLALAEPAACGVAPEVTAFLSVRAVYPCGCPDASRAAPMPPVYSLVIPIYNEEAVLPLLLRRLDALMDALDAPAEAILVDDGSQRRFADRARSQGAQRRAAIASSDCRAISAIRSRSPPAWRAPRARR